MKLIIALWIAIGFTALTSAAGLLVAFNNQHHQNDALRSILCYAEHTVKVRPGIPDRQRQQALRFYAQALADASLKPCP